MEDEDTEKKVQQYLQRKGLRVTNVAPHEERNRFHHPTAFTSLPGGFLGFPQNGHPFYPVPWPPPACNGSLPGPLPHSITQHAASGSKDKPTINIDDGDDVRTEKRLVWTPDEDLRLVGAWLNSSHDPISGNGKKNEQYWGGVVAAYNSNTPSKRERKVKHLKDRFQKIKRWVGLFCGSWKKAISTYGSELPDVELRDMALKFYLDDHKEGLFPVMHCWKVLRDEPKWHAILEDFEKSSKRKLGDEGEEGNITPMTEDTGEKERTVGTKEAKKQCNSKGKVKADDTGLEKDMKKYMRIQAAAKKRHEEFVETQLRISDAKVKAARLKKEAAMLKTYRNFMSMDPREMTDEMKAEHMVGLKSLREKLFGNTN